MPSNTMVCIVQPTLVLGRVVGVLPASPFFPHPGTGSAEEPAPAWKNVSALPGRKWRAGLQ